MRIQADDFRWGDADGPAADVRRIVAAADAADGVSSLNEAAVLHLKHRGLGDADLFLEPDGFVLRCGREVDLVVAPDARGQGLGTRLAALVLGADTGRVEAWSHADHPAAERIASRFGLERARELWVMQRPLDDGIAAVPDHPGITVRGFEPDDLPRLLEVNAHAFAQHPEQGDMSADDFAARSGEEWFDPAGLFVAIDESGDLLGFHWTKVHTTPSPAGEVYVVAVSPRAAGRGLGGVLTAVGLHHLRDLGLPTVHLYVDGDNAPAISVYRSAGFDRIRVEAQYLR